jgi:hypothetical protein
LDAIYGDVTTEFNTDIVLDDFKYDNLYSVIYTRIGSIIFNGTNTVITLNDASITTTQAHIGSDIITTPSGSDVFVGGHFSNAKGKDNFSIAIYSHSEGSSNKTFGANSHSEGVSNISRGIGSHSEGYTTVTIGYYSHSEGYSTISSGNYSHAEGDSSNSLGLYSHAEGSGSRIYGDSSHAEGINSKTGQYGYYSSGISLGVIDLDSSYGDVTSEFGSEIVFDDFIYDNIYSVTIFSVSSVTFDSVKTIITLNNTTVSTTKARIGVVGVTSPAAANQLLGGYYSHSEGNDTLSLGPFSHSQGKETISLKLGSFSSGFRSNAFGDYSFIHSYNSTVNGTNSVVLGGQNITGNTDDTVYVPYLNIKDLATGTSVNNLGVDSQGNVVVGSGSGALNTTVKLSASTGSTVVYSIPTSAYTGAFFEYTVGSGTNFRAGNITSIWDGSNAQFVDSYAGGSSPEIGSTSDISFSVGISSGNAELLSSATTTNWDVKVIVRSI